MGNSVRSTLGNMCGGQASKDIDTEDHERPVAKPKKSKKDKKNKKNKNANGTLSEITEENEKVQSSDVDKDKSSEQPQENTVNTEEPSIENSAKTLTIKERASTGELDKTDVPDVNDDDNVSDVIEHGSVDNSSEDEGEITIEKTANPDERPESRKGTFSSDISSDSKSDRLNSTEDIDKKFQHIHRVEEIKPEVLSIGYADEIFENCARTYQNFADQNMEFKSAVLEFENSVDPEKTKPDFERCWKLYTELLDEEMERKESRRTASKSQVDVCDVNVNLQAIRGTGASLLTVIREVKPEFEKSVTAAGDVDVIEYVKGKMVEGEQLGITSKFSAPGKYRRNMKHLKTGLRLLTDVETDTKDILRAVESRLGSVSSSTKPIIEDEEAIEPLQKSDNNDDEDDDIFAKLELIPRTDGAETRPETPLENVSATSSKDPNGGETLLNKSSSANERSVSPTSVDETYIIKTIPADTDKKTNHGNVSPLTKEVLSGPLKSPVNQVVVEEEDHNMLDFGKYVFVDPSTGDIQVMRNRSRSLDSLVSMQSNRSSLSRFGSFEFVTDYEINIAEKNQANKLK